MTDDIHPVGTVGTIDVWRGFFRAHGTCRIVRVMVRDTPAGHRYVVQMDGTRNGQSGYRVNVSRAEFKPLLSKPY